MNAAEAEKLLDRLAPGRPPFVQHSAAVASLAMRIAAAVREAREGIELQRIGALAMLHDAGRALTHGNYHGWVGYAMLRHRGLREYGRACVTHWLRGLELNEVIAMSSVRPTFIKRVFEELDLPQLTIDDVIISVADFSVAHTSIVSIEAREADLRARYGDSRWLRRNADEARAHRARVERWMGRALAGVAPETARGIDIIKTPVYTDKLIIYKHA